MVSPLVLAELDFLLRARVSPLVARAFLDDVTQGAYEVAPLTPVTMRKCLQLDRQHADLNLGLTDAHVMTLTQDEPNREVLTLDHRHFRAVSPGGEPMRLLPADA